PPCSRRTTTTAARPPPIRSGRSSSTRTTATRAAVPPSSAASSNGCVSGCEHGPRRRHRHRRPRLARRACRRPPPPHGASALERAPRGDGRRGGRPAARPRRRRRRVPAPVGPPGRGTGGLGGRRSRRRGARAARGRRRGGLRAAGRRRPHHRDRHRPRPAVRVLRGGAGTGPGLPGPVVPQRPGTADTDAGPLGQHDGPPRAGAARARLSRLLASIGINRVALNTVNVHAHEATLLTTRLDQVARLAELFRAQGITVHLEVSFASPILLGGLETSDPLDPGVQRWWRITAEAVYARIPDFGGFVVKADSEGQPGPFAYGRDHADGANLLARALSPYGGEVFWRAFVYHHRQDWRDRSTDRARPAHDHISPPARSA